MHKSNQADLQLTLQLIGRAVPAVEPHAARIAPPPPSADLRAPGELQPTLLETIGVILRISMMVGKAILQAWLHEVSRQLDRPEAGTGGRRSCPCPSCGSTTWTYKGKDKAKNRKVFRSIFGEVAFIRSPARCSRCRTWFHPLDVLLGLGKGKLFPGLQRICVCLGAHLPFRLAASIVEMTTGQRLAPGTIRNALREVGKSFVARMGLDWEPELAILRAAMAAAKGPVTIELMPDGCMVPMNKKPKDEDGSHREARSACFRMRDATGTILANLMFSRLTDLKSFLRDVASLVDECRETLDIHKIRICGDGASWIWDFATSNQILEQILDWFHLYEKALKLGASLHGTPTPKRRRRIQGIVDALWEGRVDQAEKLLGGLRAQDPVEREAKKELCSYLKNRRGAIRNYKWRKQRGLLIGSGAIEGGQKFIVGNRLKGAGMRWSELGADLVMAARCTVVNGTSDYDILKANLTCRAA